MKLNEIFVQKLSCGGFHLEAYNSEGELIKESDLYINTRAAAEETAERIKAKLGLDNIWFI